MGTINLAININVRCRVSLTYKGIEVLKAYYEDLGLSPPSLDEDSFLEMTLWQIMQIFGPSIEQGKTLFENNLLTLSGDY